MADTRNWPSSAAGLPNDGETPESWDRRRERMAALGINGNGLGLPLAQAAERWPTTVKTDANASGRHSTKTGVMHPRTSLTDAIRQWASPITVTGGPPSMGEDGENRHRDLQREAQQWQTPATDSFRSRGGDRKDEAGLDQQSRFWATPRTITGGGESAERKQELGREEAGGGDLQAQVEAFSRPVLSTLDGRELSPTTRTLRRRLNPAFVAWLMGLPGWWTSPAVTSFVRSEMAAYRACLHSHLRFLLSA